MTTTTDLESSAGSWGLNPWESAPEAPAVEPVSLDWHEPLQRSILQPILLLIPAFLASVANFGGGPVATDTAFVALTILCAIFLIMELIQFSQRFGIGGIVLYGGVLIWFCYDYFVHWFAAYLPSWQQQYSWQVVARSAMFHTIFIACMSFGLRFRIGRWLPKVMTKLPEPRNLDTYFIIVLATQFVGFLPYIFFTRDPFYISIYKQITAGRSGGGVAWTAGRTGSVNYSFGAYLAQVIEIGECGSILAAFYAVFLTRSALKWGVCAAIWFLWLLIGFGTGTRGSVAFMVAPLVGFIFIKYHAEAASLMKRFSLKAYTVIAILGMFTLVLVQTQIRFRNVGFADADLNQVSLVKLEGNTMFSEGLDGFERIPKQHGYFYDNFPGEAILMPIPNSIFWCAVSPMPRALWTSKPIDPVWAWHNDVAMGGTGEDPQNLNGTTVSEGLVGNWYFRYGPAGVLEGGLIMGWLMGCTERTLVNNRGRPMAVLFALGIATWLFRCYRDLTFLELNQVLVGLVGISLLILFIRPFTSAGPQQEAPAYA